MNNIIDKAFSVHELTNQEICDILSENNCDYLFQKADETRQQFIGDLVKIYGLFQITNICSQNCLYCRDRKDNTKQRFTFSTEDAVTVIKNFSKTGIKNIIIQSGDTTAVSVDSISEIIGRLKIYNINAIPSLGEKNEAEYRKLRDEGAEQINVNIMTSSFTLFEELHPDATLMGKKSAIRFLKKIGIKTGSGILVGFPNQTYSSLADDILYLKNLDIDCIEVIPFVPYEDTPLKDENIVNIEKIKKVISIIRLLMPSKNILISENMENVSLDGTAIALQVGANVISKSITDISGNINKIDIDDIDKLLSSVHRQR